MIFLTGFAVLIPSLLSVLTGKFSLQPGAVGALTIAFAFVTVLGAYLLGSINPAILISTRIYHSDIREHGSGNAGTTNMLRTYGKNAAIATFAIDLLKAAAAYFLGAVLLGVPGAALGGFFAVFGHVLPVFNHFRGGKGVACLAMVALLSSPMTFLILLGAFLVIAIGTRFVSLASIMCAMIYPLILNAFAPLPLNAAMAIFSAVTVILMHRSNIKRMWNGEENKLDFSKFKSGKRGKGDGNDGE